MAELKTINLPDVGDFDEIEIIEILIVAGDEIAAEDSIIVLESDKATMEIPSPYAGTVKSVLVRVGDRISEGTEIAKVEISTPSSIEKSTPPDAADVEIEKVSEQTPTPAPESTEPENSESAVAPPQEPALGKQRKPPPG